MIRLDIRIQSWTKKFDSDSTQKSPTPYDSDSGSNSATLVSGPHFEARTWPEPNIYFWSAI